MANLAQDQFIGRITASTGVPETTTITSAARTVLDDTTVSAMVDTLGGASATGSGGLVRATAPALAGNATAVTATFGDDDTSIATTEFITNSRGGTNSWGSQTIDFSRGRNILTNVSAAITITGVAAGFSNNRLNEQYIDFSPDSTTRVLTVPTEWYVSGFTNGTTVALTNGVWAEMCVTAIIGRRTNAVINFYQ